MLEIQITPDVSIGDAHPCFIVAEIGQNHNGDARIANDLIRVAHHAGASAVKFCKRHLPSEMTAEMRARPYDNPNSFGATYGEHRERLEFSKEDYKFIKRRALEFNGWSPLFFATACDVQSVADLEEVGVPLYKVASRDLTNLPLIECIAATGKPVILSTGMDGEADIARAVEAVRKYHDKLVLLHCTSEYPTPPEHVNLLAMLTLRERFECLVGLSDHTAGIKAAVAAAVLGACVVEKHITFSRAAKGTDHAGSLEPKGLASLVEWIRYNEQIIGDGELGHGGEVTAARHKLRRSLVTARPIAKGETIQEQDLCLKSPGTGLAWHERESVVGKAAAFDLPADVTLTGDCVL